MMGGTHKEQNEETHYRIQIVSSFPIERRIECRNIIGSHPLKSWNN